MKKQKIPGAVFKERENLSDNFTGLRIIKYVTHKTPLHFYWQHKTWCFY